MFFERNVGIGQITQNRMKELLRALTAKFSGLNEAEIIGGYAKKRTTIHNDLLEVRIKSDKTFIMSCGADPHFIATTAEIRGG